MAIIQQPQFLSPSNNDQIFQFGSTFSNILYFDVNVYDKNTDELILNDKAYVTPINPTSSYYNIEDVNRSLVKCDIATYSFTDTSPTFLENNVSSYYLKVAEYGYDSVNNQVKLYGATATSSTKYIWDAQLNRAEYSKYHWWDWVLSVSPDNSLNGRLLTEYREKKTYKGAKEYVYMFVYNEPVSIGIDVRDKNGTSIDGINKFIGTKYTSGPGYVVGLLGVDVSPLKIKEVIGTASFNNMAYFDIDVYSENIGGSMIDSFRFYTLEQPCNEEYLNVIWSNRLGGVETYQFINPIITKDVERTSIKVNEFRINDNGVYSDIDGDIFNEREKIINIEKDSTVKVWTRWMTDDENRIIAGLLTSENIYIEYNDLLYPVTLVETSYTLNKQKYDRNQPLQSQWTFKISGDMVDDDTIVSLNSEPELPTTTTTTTSTTTTTTTAAPITTSTTTTTTTIGGTSSCTSCKEFSILWDFSGTDRIFYTDCVGEPSFKVVAYPANTNFCACIDPGYTYPYSMNGYAQPVEGVDCFGA